MRPAPRLPTLKRPAAHYGCGCGCNSCGGSSQYAGTPIWLWQGDDYAQCPEYKAAVDTYETAKRTFQGLSGSSKRGARGDELKAVMRQAETDGKAAKKRCKSARRDERRQQRQGGGMETLAPLDMSAAGLTNDLSTDSGINLGLVAAIGGVALIGTVGFAFVMKKRRAAAAAKKAAMSGVRK